MGFKWVGTDSTSFSILLNDNDIIKNFHADLGTPEDFIYPYENFLDTVNQLDEKGKTLRTKRIIDLLQEEPVLLAPK